MNRSTTTTMDVKHIARFLGALSIEERVQIIQQLLAVGSDGLSVQDIAVRTELGASAVFKQLEALAGIELVFVKSVDNTKVYIANTLLLDELFASLYQQYGPSIHARLEQQLREALENQSAQP
jgi:DNA-binding transcriptional ArsR family regulator